MGELHQIVVDGGDRKRVLFATESVDGVGQVGLDVGAAFGGGHHAELATGFDDPLPLLAIPHQVGLEQVRAVLVAVLAKGPPDLVQGLEAGGEEMVGGRAQRNPGSGREDPWAGYPVGVHNVGDREDVRG